VILAHDPPVKALPRGFNNIELNNVGKTPAHCPLFQVIFGGPALKVFKHFPCTFEVRPGSPEAIADSRHYYQGKAPLTQARKYSNQLKCRL